MIPHLSLAASQPERVAGVLAELMGGSRCPTRETFRLAGRRTRLRGRSLPDRDGIAARQCHRRQLCPRETGRGFGLTHVPLSVATDSDTVERIARREGWQCFRCNRGPFHVIEVWVENETLLEILPRKTRANTAPSQRSQGFNLTKAKYRPSK